MKQVYNKGEDLELIIAMLLLILPHVRTIRCKHTSYIHISLGGLPSRYQEEIWLRH